jgi:gas vesicle protein
MQQIDATRKRSSAAPIALLAGLTAGIAAGLFLRTEKGQQLTEEAKKRAKKLQNNLLEKLRDVKEITQEKYEEIVDDLLMQYAETKSLAAGELKRLRAYLMDQWEDIRDQLQNGKMKKQVERDRRIKDQEEAEWDQEN